MRGDVRATFGGEPTFVGIDAPDAPEWNTAALGDAKAERAEDLLRRLHARFAPGALLHFGQGKWYPGEPLPRWAFGCYWRKDGEPIWEDATLFADARTGCEFGDVEAQRFVARSPSVSGWIRVTRMRAYEDAWYYLWRERRLPTNVDPLDARVDDEQERARLARIFERGSGRDRGLGAAARARPRLARSSHALAQRAVVPAPRALVPAARRFADGLPAAARFAAVVGSRRTAPRGSRSIRWRCFRRSRRASASNTFSRRAPRRRAATLRTPSTCAGRDTACPRAA